MDARAAGILRPIRPATLGRAGDVRRPGQESDPSASKGSTPVSSGPRVLNTAVGVLPLLEDAAVLEELSKVAAGKVTRTLHELTVRKGLTQLKDDQANVAHFVFDLHGNLASPVPEVDYDDVFAVHFPMDVTRPRDYSVRFTGVTTVHTKLLIADQGTVDAVNTGVELREARKTDLATPPASRDRIQMKTAYAGPFSGLVKLHVVTPYVGKTDPMSVTVAPAVVAVHADDLYRFAARASVISAGGKSKKYSATTGLIRSTETGPDVEFGVSVIAYVWDQRGRDLRKPAVGIHRVNPVFGMGFNNAPKNVHVGLAFEVARGFELVAGVRSQRVDKLMPGLSEGLAGKDPVQTVGAWDSGPFFGVTIAADVFSQVFSQF